MKDILKNIGSYYLETQVVKTKEGYPQVKNGTEQTRTVHTSQWQLRYIQKRILKNILSKLSIPDYAYGSVIKRNNILNAKQHRRNKYFMMIDLEKFFPSITHNMVFETFVSFDFSHTTSRFLTKLTTYKGCLPQGLSTSPMIANLVFNKTGNKLQKFAQENNLTFTTFLDDLSFSSTNNFEKKMSSIIQILNDDNYKISLDKTIYTDTEPVITGILIKDGWLQLTDTYKWKLLNPINYNYEQREGHKRYFKQVEDANDDY